MEIGKILENFREKGFKPFYFDSSGKLKDFLLNEISGTTVGMGGSMTIQELDIYNLLSQNNKVYSHSVCSDAGVMQNASLSESYVLSANALAETGEIINIDGRGNRVAGSIFGANLKRVFYICGTNKLAENIEKGIWRAINIAAPKNAQRLGRKTPCAVRADKCYNCKSPERICRATVIITNPLINVETFVLIVEGNYGF